MNVHHAERIAGQPDEVGYAPVADGAQPDVVVFNTCTVRENADQTSSTATSTTSSRSRTARPACRSPSALLAQEDQATIHLRDGNRRRWTENTAGARRTGRGYLRAAPRSDVDVRSPGEIRLADTGDRR
jgi:Uncharacterized protein family UPF0004